MELGKLIRKYRKQKKLTQQELAIKSNISLMSIRRYESGERIPSFDRKLSLASALEINPLELMDENEEIFNEHMKKYLKNSFSERFYDVVETMQDKFEMDANFSDLTTDGQKKVFDYVNDLLGNPKYRYGTNDDDYNDQLPTQSNLRKKSKDKDNKVK